MYVDFSSIKKIMANLKVIFGGISSSINLLFMSEESDRISFFPSYHTWQIYAWFMLNSNGLIWVYYIYAGKIIREIEIDNLILHTQILTYSTLECA